MTDPVADAPGQRGLFASAKGLLGTGVSLLHNRLELLGVELAEERVRLFSLLAYGGAAFLCLAAGLIFLAVFLTVLMWDSNRLLALAVFSALFLGAGIVSLLVTMRLARSDWEWTASAGSSSTTSPRRRMAISSARAMTSPSLWEM